jgi:serine kinase of HPr protein (carbohydrate metabolism regulator)
VSAPPILHATAIARFSKGAWRGALLRGGSGAGKSDLALRAMAAGWRLVGDDRVVAWASGGRLFARAAEPLYGLIEARGLGVVAAPALAWTEAALAVDLVSEPPERVPEPTWTVIETVRLPLVRIVALEASAPAKLALALEAATLG